MTESLLMTLGNPLTAENHQTAENHGWNHSDSRETRLGTLRQLRARRQLATCMLPIIGRLSANDH